MTTEYWLVEISLKVKDVKTVEIEIELPEWLDKKVEEAGINLSEVLCEYLIEKYNLA